MSRFVQFIARTRVGRIAAAFVLAASGLTVGVVAAAGPADAATCYGGAKYFGTGPHDSHYLPRDGTWTTTSRCSDINLKITSTSLDTEVRVCFYPSSGGMSCQSSYKKVGDKNWKVVASGVKDGTKFRFQFRYSGAWLNGYAAF